MTAQELKDFCKSQNLTYKELGELIGYGEGAIKNAISTDKVSTQMAHAIKMYLRIQELETKLTKSETIKTIFKEWVSEN